MSYTVKQLAKISGVSSRTLRHYDEIGLLKPASKGANKYRYYGIEELLLLQQILFYRELGFALADIKKIVDSNQFNKIESLNSHKLKLKREVERINQLIKTIDKTVLHLQGQKVMKNEEFYYGFDSETQKKHERDLVAKGVVTQEFIDESNAKVKNWSDKQKNDFIVDIERIMSQLVLALEEGKQPDDKLVQKLMHQHYQWLKRSWTPDKQKYLGLAKLYQTPDFADFYNKRHPKLLDFMIKAMQVYADTLS